MKITNNLEIQAPSNQSIDNCTTLSCDLVSELSEGSMVAVTRCQIQADIRELSHPTNGQRIVQVKSRTLSSFGSSSEPKPTPRFGKSEAHYQDAVLITKGVFLTNLQRRALNANTTEEEAELCNSISEVRAELKMQFVEQWKNKISPQLLNGYDVTSDEESADKMESDRVRVVQQVAQLASTFSEMNEASNQLIREAFRAES